MSPTRFGSNTTSDSHRLLNPSSPAKRPSELLVAQKAGVERSTDGASYKLVRAALIVLSVALTGLAGATEVFGQYTRLNTPLQTNTESYYERIGTNFGFSFPGSRRAMNGSGSGIVGLNPDGSFTRDGSIRFTQNGAGSAVPPFGGYDPNTDATFGFAKVNPGGGGFNLGLSLGQGNSRTATSTTPSIVVPNGYPGFISDSRVSPFVTGIIPVVGGGPPAAYRQLFTPGPTISPLDLSLSRLRQEMDAGRVYRDANGRFVFKDDAQSTTTSAEVAQQEDAGGGLILRGGSRQAAAGGGVALQSSAATGDLSLAEIRRRREAAEAAEEADRVATIQQKIEEADRLIAERKPGVARIRLKEAARLAKGQQRQELLKRIAELQ